MVTVSDDVSVNIGANASAEEENEEYGAASRQVNNIVDAFRLNETTFTKASYMDYIKDYMKRGVAKLKEKNPDRVEGFQKAAQGFVKKVLGSFNDYQFFSVESNDPDAMIVLCIWRENTPVMIYFKDLIEEMKV